MLRPSVADIAPATKDDEDDRPEEELASPLSPSLCPATRALGDLAEVMVAIEGKVGFFTGISLERPSIARALMLALGRTGWPEAAVLVLVVVVVVVVGEGADAADAPVILPALLPVADVLVIEDVDDDEEEEEDDEGRADVDAAGGDVRGAAVGATTAGDGFLLIAVFSWGLSR